MALLEASGIGKNFGETKVLKDISLTLEQGEALAIIGSSGSGKTTLLRCLNFLERPDTGVIRVNGETMWDAADPATQRESEVRKKRLHFGMVFQSFNLFPQYTALENVTLARELMAKNNGESREDIRSAGMELLSQMGLVDRANHYPHQLSGGERQRVYLAMALAQGGTTILLDEPGAFLDVRAQFELLDLLRSVAAGGKAVVLVMHELPQAMQYADRIALLGGGRLLGCDTSAALAATGAVDRVFGVRLCRAPDGVWYVKAEG